MGRWFVYVELALSHGRADLASRLGIIQLVTLEVRTLDIADNVYCL